MFPGPGFSAPRMGQSDYLCVCVLTINGEVDVSGLPSFASIRDRSTIIFDSRKTLYLKEPTAKLLKTYLKDNGNICFVVI